MDRREFLNLLAIASAAGLPISSREALAAADALGQVGVGELGEAGFIVEQLHLRGAAGLEEIDDALGPGGEVGEAFESANTGR